MALTPQNYADPVVTIATTMGNITLELFPTQAPITVANFLTYAYSGFYAGTIFHRVVADFVDQGGGYTADLQAKPTLPPIPLETPNGLSNVAGTIAMARTTDPNSATSQFYINAVNNTYLDYTSPSNPGYAVFGDVISGMSVVTAINNVAVDGSDIPLTPVVINSVTTSVYYPGDRADYTISMVGGQLAVTLLSDAPSESSLPAASILAKTNDLQFADITVDPAADTVGNIVSAFNGGTLSAPTDLFDTAANVSASLGTLQSIAAAGKLIAIGFTDSGTPTLTLTPAQLFADATALNDISGSYTISLTGTTSLSVTPAELISAAAALKAVGSDVTFTIDGSAPNITVDAVAGHANTVVFSGTAGEYTIAPVGNGLTQFTVTDTGTGRTSVDTLNTNVTALQFSDMTDIVAQQPGGASAVTTGNITELYSAVLAREPDVSGLSFYQNALQKSPGTSLLTFAIYFLDSGEYTSNPAHNYAQSAAGDEQFITDSYQNLLHRTPSASEVSYYETNVLAPAVANQTAGTAAYAAAQLQAHALMLVYFSASSEFLADVQVTATNPSSAQHWLILV